MQSHVQLQSAHLCKTLSAFFTFHRLLLAVYEEVFDQIGFRYSSIIAFVAAVGPFAAVTSHVNFQLSLLRTFVLTTFTLEGFTSIVFHHVPGQFARFNTGIITVFTFVRLLPTVYEPVPLHAASLSAGVVAMWTIVWFSPVIRGV